MKKDRNIHLRLINKHFQKLYGHAYVQKQLIADKERARYVMQRHPGKYIGY